MQFWRNYIQTRCIGKFGENRLISLWAVSHLNRTCRPSMQTYFSGAWRHDIISARFEDALEQARRLYSFTARSRKTENDHRFRESRHVSFGHWLFQRCHTSAQTYFSGAWRHDIIRARFEAAFEQARRLYAFTTRSRKTENDHRFRENRHVLFGPRWFQRATHPRRPIFEVRGAMIS